MHRWKSFKVLLHSGLQQAHPDLCQIMEHLLSAPGQYLRPRLIFLCAQLFDIEESDYLNLACAIEYIHCSSLLHDDVMDHGEMRRGKLCAHRIWGNARAILAGDFLLVRAFYCLTSLQNHQVSVLLQNTTESLLNGQAAEYHMHTHSPIEHYLRLVEEKTAHLFAAACKGIALLACAHEDHVEAMWRFGLYLGMAYQLYDDKRDYERDPQFWTEGHDFVERKWTLPLLLGIKQDQEIARLCALDSHILTLEDKMCLADRIKPYLDQTFLIIQDYVNQAVLSLKSWPEQNVRQLVEYAHSLCSP